MSRSISNVLDKGEIYTWFQSIVNINSREIIGYEALARGPAGKYHFPAGLFDGAKRCGLLEEVEKACLSCAMEWALQILSAKPGLKVFINFNPLQAEYIDSVVSGIRSLSRNSVVFEMTEHSRILDFKKIVNVCRELKEKGYLIAIDDIGSGYDRLRSIAEFSPDYIKVDRPLVSGTVKNGNFKAVVKSIVAMANEMGCSIIAEGIENLEELRMMKKLGISIGQGYYFSRPKPVESLFHDVFHNAAVLS